MQQGTICTVVGHKQSEPNKSRFPTRFRVMSSQLQLRLVVGLVEDERETISALQSRMGWSGQKSNITPVRHLRARAKRDGPLWSERRLTVR